MFSKQKEEMQKTVNDVKTSFGDNVKSVVKESKLMVFLVSCTTCLITGFIMGSVTTAVVGNTVNKLNSR